MQGEGFVSESIYEQGPWETRFTLSRHSREASDISQVMQASEFTHETTSTSYDGTTEFDTRALFYRAFTCELRAYHILSCLDSRNATECTSCSQYTNRRGISTRSHYLRCASPAQEGNLSCCEGSRMNILKDRNGRKDRFPDL